MTDIRKRTGKRGVSWQVRFKDARTGKRHYKSFPRRKDAEAFISETTLPQYIADSQTITVAEAADRWLKVCKTTGRKGREPIELSTARKYEEHVGKIKTLIGNLKLNELTPVRCSEFCEDLLAEYSRPYAKKILTSFKSILSQARTDGHMRSNPAENVSIVISSRYAKNATSEVPSISEMRQFLVKIDELSRSKDLRVQLAWRRYAPFFLVLIYSGMRPCEALGLPWSNVDFKAGTLEVTQDATENGEIGLPKSASSYRKIHMPPVVMTALKRWKLSCPGSALDLVFPNGNGRVESLANVTNRGWYVLQRKCKFLDKEGKPRFPLKSLRHVRASLEIHNDATPKEVQSLMGHSSIQVTFDVYGHLFKDHEEERASRANAIAQQLSEKSTVIVI